MVHILVAGVEKLMKTYSENPSFSNQKNLEETEEQLDEVNCSVCRVEGWLLVCADGCLF